MNLDVVDVAAHSLAFIQPSYQRHWKCVLKTRYANDCPLPSTATSVPPHPPWAHLSIAPTPNVPVLSIFFFCFAFSILSSTCCGCSVPTSLISVLACSSLRLLLSNLSAFNRSDISFSSSFSKGILCVVPSSGQKSGTVKRVSRLVPKYHIQAMGNIMYMPNFV